MRSTSVVGPCQFSNGGCSQFCFATSANDRVCDCADEYKLDGDGHSCIYREKHCLHNYITVFAKNAIFLNFGKIMFFR